MEIVRYNTINSIQKLAVIALWNNGFPEQLIHPHLNSFDAYLAHKPDPNHYFIKHQNGDIKGWFFDFLRDDERWFSMIVDDTIVGKGFGTRLLNTAKSNNLALNGWVIDHENDKRLNGTPYPSPIGFYLKNDFKFVEGIRLELPVLSAVKMRWVAMD